MDSGIGLPSKKYEWMRLEKKVLDHGHLEPDETGALIAELRIRFFPEKADLILNDPIVVVCSD